LGFWDDERVLMEESHRNSLFYVKDGGSRCIPRGSLMTNTKKPELWVVYRMTLHGKPSQRGAVCEQNEWEAMERVKPGYHTLVRSGIANEGEAERMARSILVDDTISKPAKLSPPAE
jgi:hypothetical protein